MAVDTTALTKLMDERATGVVVEAGGYQSFSYTLDGVLGYWVVSALLYPYQMNGQDPITATKIFALNFCATRPYLDCSQIDNEALAFGNFLQAAMNNQPLPPLPPPPFSTGTGPYKTIPGVVQSDVPAIPPPPPPIDQSVPSPTLQALMTTAPASTPAPAPTPTPAPTMPTADEQHVSVPRPMDIFSGLLGSGGGAGGGAEAGTWAAPVTFGVSIVVGAILGALFGSLFGGSDTKALQQAINQLRTALAQTADELERFAWSIAVGLGRLFQAIAGIWDTFLDAVWTYLKQLWKLLWCLVDTIIPKIINVLRDLRKFLDTVYLKYILPAMRYLLRVRQVLAILRALHVPIAAQLDKILGQIQGALFLPFTYLLRSLNGYGGWFNFILTSRLILQRPLFLNTMYAYQADWINMFYTAQSGQQGPVGTLGPAATGTSSFANWLTEGGTAGGSSDTTAQVMTVAEACAWITVFATTGSGELADTAQGALVALNQQLGQ